MGVYTGTFEVSTRGETDIINITDQVKTLVQKSGIKKGAAGVYTAGSTAGITTIEYESGLISDLKNAYEKLAPRNGEYAHNLRWGDGNGYAHIRAAFTGQDLSFAISEGVPVLGTWQQIILVDFDNRPRTREVMAVVMGE
ncbi:MAG: secondary thiamine-phosphate synthase enzyme YjbQ [Spirochaetota bacterium]